MFGFVFWNYLFDYSELKVAIIILSCLDKPIMIWLFDIFLFLKVGYDKQGLQTGLQMIGRPWGEATILLP